MPTENITLVYGDRTVKFPIDSIEIGHNVFGTLYVDIEAGWGDLDMAGDDSCYGPPIVRASWDHGRSTPISNLPGTSIHIPKSYSEEIQDHVATFYLSAHLDLNDVKLKFEALDDSFLIVEFAGFVPEDPTGSEPDTGIKVSGRAKLKLPVSD